jgi:crotonobetainyl-CoA:carnitine CoA-transferase CaiB-like acyl-CoA transferase
VTGPLAGLHVVELASEISGPYATKLFVDLGAEVTKIEPPTGDPLRLWGPFPGGVADPQRSGLFEYLNAGKRGANLTDAAELIAQANVLVENFTPGTLDGWGFDVDTLRQLNPNLVLLRISHFGQSGLWRHRQATSLTLQAASGWIGPRDPARPPVQVGARIAEYVAGAYGALGALTALRLPPMGHVTEVDVSELESLLSTLPYPMLMAQRMRRLGLPTNVRSAPMLGVVRAADGWVGINCLTGQHWLDVCAMLGLPEFAEDQIAITLGGPERAEFFARAEPLLAKQTVVEIVELSQSLRIPAAPVNDGATVLECPQYAKRGFFVESGGFQRPGSPFRFTNAASWGHAPTSGWGYLPLVGADPHPLAGDSGAYG